MRSTPKAAVALALCAAAISTPAQPQQAAGTAEQLYVIECAQGLPQLYD